MDKDLVWTGEDLKDNWFYNRYYYAGANSRYSTFHMCLNLLNQRHPNPTIVETGCQRLRDDLGGGMSTSIFTEYLYRHAPEGSLISVDISHASLEAAKQCIAEWPNIDVTLVCADSVTYLKDYNGPCDLLYLDSWDYPYELFLNHFGGQEDVEAALEQTRQLTRGQALDMFGNLVLPCQEHALKEFLAIEDRLSETCILLVDDNQLSGGGKPRLLKDYLASKKDWINLFDFQASLWLRRL
jgi:hypothetical protein